MMYYDKKEFNLTQVFFRFLKDNNAFTAFQKAIFTRQEGRMLHQALYDMSREKLDKLTVTPNFPQSYRNKNDIISLLKTDPLKFLLFNNDANVREHFINDLINYNICWADTKEGDVYWQHLNTKWHNVNNKIKRGEYHIEQVSAPWYKDKNTSLCSKLFASFKKRFPSLCDTENLFLNLAATLLGAEIGLFIYLFLCT